MMGKIASVTEAGLRRWDRGRLAQVSPTFAHLASFRTEADQTPPRRKKRHLSSGLG
jgi:hypothetical protein